MSYIHIRYINNGIVSQVPDFRRYHKGAERPLRPVVMRKHVLGFATFALSALALAGTVSPAAAQCNYPVLRNQRRDEATILALERSWSEAFITGDTTFERCLLAPGFREIRLDGRIFTLADELALARANTGKRLHLGASPHISVLIYGNSAAAYYTQRSRATKQLVTGADFFTWNGSGWRVFFSQQTSGGAL
jgi:hypothetical protein